MQGSVNTLDAIEWVKCMVWDLYFNNAVKKKKAVKREILSMLATLIEAMVCLV